ncbi:MAG: hypothetical protein ACFFDS_04835, partial [Candidatus Thorarchaeota archaeon]
VSPSLLESDKQLLHGFVDVLSETKEQFIGNGEDKEILESIDKKLSDISTNVTQIYNEETFNLYAALNIVAVVIIAIAWFLIAYFT